MELVVFFLVGIVVVAVVRRHRAAVCESVGNARSWYRARVAWIVGILLTILPFLQPWLSDQVDKATTPVYDPPPVHYEP